MVRSTGLEPVRLAAAGFESAVSAYSNHERMAGVERFELTKNPLQRRVHIPVVRHPNRLLRPLVTRELTRLAATSLGPALSRGPRPVGALLIGCAFEAHNTLLG